MVAGVCSATFALGRARALRPRAQRQAVHTATLRRAGLVGLIAEEARPLNLPDAQAHPAFAYLPETGEEIYHSFLGVPVLRAGRTLGVLVVQNRSHRTYTEEEIEALQTTAMVFGDDRRRRPGGLSRRGRRWTCRGRSPSRGWASANGWASAGSSSTSRAWW
jgi:phosphotransferase system enzyme I (PtsP)